MQYTHREGLQDPVFGVKHTRVYVREGVRQSQMTRLDATPLDRPSFEQIEALFNDVEFDESTVPSFGVDNGIELLAVKAVSICGRFWGECV